MLWLPKCGCRDRAGESEGTGGGPMELSITGGASGLGKWRLTKREPVGPVRLGLQYLKTALLQDMWKEKIIDIKLDKNILHPLLNIYYNLHWYLLEFCWHLSLPFDNLLIKRDIWVTFSSSCLSSLYSTLELHWT
jgi:hypothetical protein